ncbi:Regulatory protein TetR OS=Tsukamurella paurometabola (strain ATCC 8368 / DSM / CCUG 35730 /CIP 100753 / JCM 10117 / KCTC 9821 / NBRC 16120 / NCIMB 702349/ NCTC 13040) OX=521096 GN=Tpau_0853 PE=4 SV=1 [Tsukamurella paurometabola]|uniref:Regulatory protein TetR n=1 Tax=Tsukamurella paurometabola (strain ATCC 8368 / DSM 20162 / CCUG 35730 / CIP 100753 / JCM 10117 / KCTC 9821 / NBRC 16120 / NCIMB 702349 / NCTC 13040) TaxID=521096 RepID=D5UUB7_TSUPD|nr:TetR family transcriptional regulator [Tsukamurella paurometabola]ADG77488.1 regulatory protein TetR [Tsukamurella paurometabola DSM 20162]SUP27365.1 division inhibitor protein [Tsukamurella paurometabola]
MSFQRARSEEQRLQRRESILAAADAMLAEMPVAEITLTGLSRRVGLAKSNVLRYFESREDVLLELLVRSARDWVAELGAAAAAAIDPAAPVDDRVDRIAALFAGSAADHPGLLDLLSAQAGVLEQNVSAEAVLRFKRAVLTVMTDLATVLRTAIPELGDGALALCAMAVSIAGALYAQARQSEACAAAYRADPALAVFRTDLVPALTGAFATLISGALARAGR